MADEAENDDQWLYGDNDPQPAEPTPQLQPERAEEAPNEDAQNNTAAVSPILIRFKCMFHLFLQEPEQEEAKDAANEEETSKENDKEEGEEDDDTQQNGEGSEKDDSEEDSDDDVNVVIGDIKTSPQYTSTLNIKRGGLLTSASGDKSKQQQTGKFNVEEFDQVGTINGVPAVDFNLDSLEDKPWRKPGADITDYFNYGFNEDTWRAYCERQKR